MEKSAEKYLFGTFGAKFSSGSIVNSHDLKNSFSGLLENENPQIFELSSTEKSVLPYLADQGRKIRNAHHL